MSGAMSDVASPPNPRRSLLGPPAALALVGLLAALLLYWLDAMVAGPHVGLSINRHSLWGRDFANLWSAGRIAIEGKSELLYDLKAYQAWQVATFGPILDEHNYSYPPSSLLYAPLFGALPYLAALALFSALSFGLFFLAARPWLVRVGLSPWLALLLPSSLVCLWAGHYGLIVGALWLYAWRNLDDRPERAGVAIGLMLVKPHLAILIPLVLLRRRAWRTVAVAALTVAVLVGASGLLFGFELWRVWLGSTSGFQMSLLRQPHALWSYMMPTIAPALFAYGVAPGIVWPLQLLLSIGTIVLLLWRLPEDLTRAAGLTAVATFLVLPYGFNYDLTVVGLAALLLFAEAMRAGRKIDAWIAAASIALPSTMVYLAMMGWRIAPLVLAAQFVVMLRVSESRGQTPSATPSPFPA